MNRHLLILLFLCHYTVTQAQQYQYVPMPLSDGEWRYRFVTEKGQRGNPSISVTIDDYILRGSGIDTIIDGKTYKKIMYRGNRESGYKPLNFPLQHVVADEPEMTRLCLREDNKRVYWHTDYHDTLLYNFEAVVGDTIPRFYMYWSKMDRYKVYDIDTVNVANTLRKRFWAHELYYNADTIAVIEGIGIHSGGLMMPSVTGPVGMYTHISTFCCFTAPGITYPENSSSCYLVWPYGTPTSVSNTTEDKPLSIYPNPFTDAIHIEEVAEGNAILHSSAGIKIAEQAVVKGTNKINTAQLPPGIYLLQIKDKHGNVLHRQKLVK